MLVYVYLNRLNRFAPGPKDVVDHTEELRDKNGTVVAALDYDDEGNIIGIEVLYAERVTSEVIAVS